MSITYERVNWEDSPSTQTPVNADNLNNMDAGIADLADWVNENEDALNDSVLIASEFEAMQSYTAGDLLIHDNKLYRVNSDIQPLEWNASQYTEVKLNKAIHDLAHGIIAKRFVKLNAWERQVGEYVIHGTDLYRVTVANTDMVWDATKYVKVTSLGSEVQNLKSTVTNLSSAVSDLNTDVTDLKADLSGVNTALDDKANIDGYYEEMTVGDAEQLVSTQFIEDSVPYLYRTSGGSEDIGNREYCEIVGGSINYNQLCNTSNSVTRSGITATADSQSSKVIFNGTATADFSLNWNLSDVATGHKILFYGCPSGGSLSTYYGRNGYYADVSRSDLGSGKLTEINSSIPRFIYQFVIKSGTTVNNMVVTPQMFDLTVMFGTTIADYIYSLEQASVGTGVAWFRKLFSKDYYAYDVGTLKHVEGLYSHDMVGFNQYNPTTGTCEVISGKQYQIAGTYTAISINGETITPDSSGIFTPSANGTLTVTGGNDTDTCVHLVWSGTRNGEYEPYVKHSYALDDSLTLRGIPKLDSSNNLYYDGDTYAADGTVTRKYKLLTLDGSESWNLQSINDYGIANFFVRIDNYDTNQLEAICDRFLQQTTLAAQTQTEGFLLSGGAYLYLRIDSSKATTPTELKSWLSQNPTNVVYKLATPTMETATPYNEVQIVDDWGTEEYVSTSIVPVGHNTRYPQNLRDKLQHLPSLADSDGYYLIHQDGTQMELVAFHIPKATGLADGTYTLKATVSGGTPTYTWEAET